jgi:hypothetical protein
MYCNQKLHDFIGGVYLSSFYNHPEDEWPRLIGDYYVIKAHS